LTRAHGGLFSAHETHFVWLFILSFSLAARARPGRATQQQWTRSTAGLQERLDAQRRRANALTRWKRNQRVARQAGRVRRKQDELKNLATGPGN